MDYTFLETRGYTITDNIIFQDNKSVMLLEKNGQRSSRKNAGHLEIDYYFITDNVNRDKVNSKYCPTDNTLGDFFRKPVQGSKFRKFCRRIMNLPNSPVTAAQECVGARGFSSDTTGTPARKPRLANNEWTRATEKYRVGSILRVEVRVGIVRRRSECYTKNGVSRSFRQTPIAEDAKIKNKQRGSNFPIQWLDLITVSRGN